MRETQQQEAGGMKAMFPIALAASLATGCYEPGPTATDELVGELRALRRQHAAMAGNGTTALAALPPTALLPLREALTELVQSQRQIEARQLALTQEMQRWSGLVVATAAQHGGEVAKAGGDDAKAMLARLDQLEKDLRGQDLRHQRVEALLGGALDRTAERLEEFLQRVLPRAPQQLGGEPPAATAPAGAKPPSPAAADPTAPPAPRNPESPRRDERAGASFAVPDAQRAHLERIGWLILAAMSFSAGCWFLLLARREPPLPPLPMPEPADEPQPASEPLPSPTAAPGKDADDLWRAAAMLGEVVGRLKQTPADPNPANLPPTAQHPGAQDPSIQDPGTQDPGTEVPGDSAHAAAIEAPAARLPTPTAAAPTNRWQPDGGAAPAVDAAKPAAQPHDLGLPRAGSPDAALDTAVRALAPALLPSALAAPPTPPEPRARPPRPPGTGRPQAFICQLQPRDVDGAMQILPALLAQDPRVLRWPSPTIVRAGRGIEVSFLLVPAVPPGERGQLEQSLREACR